MENNTNKKSSGFYHKQTGVYFPNRQAAIILMGVSRYNRFLSNSEFEWEDKKNYPIAY